VKLFGIGVSGGRACARLYVVQDIDPAGTEVTAAPEVPVREWRERLIEALAQSRQELSALVAAAALKVGASHAAIFQAQLMLLDDDEWAGAITQAVAEGQPATAAVRQVSDEIAQSLQALDDEYLRERAADVLDVADRVLRNLGSGTRKNLPTSADGAVVLAASELAPSDTLNLEPAVVRAIITERGTRTSHAAILSRQLGIPAVMAVEGLLAVAEDGALCAVDGGTGECDLAPDPQKAAEFRSAPVALEVSHDVAMTSDGFAVSVCANAAAPDDVALGVHFGADGVGLFRTEMLLHKHDLLYDEDQQLELYSAAAAAAEGRPVVFRTFDVGADKQVNGFSMEDEANPFMGLRGVRLTLARRDIFEIQLRALARASQKYPNVEVMVPMISGLEEVDQVLELLRGATDDQALRFGAMVEVPSAVLLAGELAARVDFLSIGTNDLTAYLLAVDRNNAKLSGLYNELHPAVLRALIIVFDAGQRAGTKVSVCGELAGDLRSLPLLIGMGLRSFSVAPPTVPRLKSAIKKIDSQAASIFARKVLEASRVQEVEDLLATWHADATAQAPDAADAR
jgi:phosphotransferase system enzyme I (PtsI)